jgi:hypothetical protein
VRVEEAKLKFIMERYGSDAAAIGRAAEHEA